MMEYIVVLITASKEEEAAHIAKEVVASGLAACVNIIRDIRSIYRWQGKVEDQGEVLLIIKTRAALFEDLMKKVREHHSYAVPEIIALPILMGSENYLKWLNDETEK
jgi:periplasmic divalent cation tolerance protein